ncbi:Clathrin coat assembly protein [Thalictrum thalictroides]|uniref:Clathrin coat assembly protein n=1 Tax=Thalictrum thalictroides TaxID=46969 RepID=A0A7J6URZ1_THATH|nr:Clathrin coat assembly protein [Thalictrum thalictroides]
MAGAGGTQSLRKAIGALKDSTKVGLAKVNSEYKDLDIAVVKATNHVERISKEKHIRTIFTAVTASRPRADVAYCIYALARRLSKTHNWAVALKTLIVIHRALREVDSTFREELINYTKSRGHMLNLSHFKDDSSPIAWDYSAWVRVYALYLEERLECFHILKYDVEADQSRTRELDTPGLLEQLPALQQLLFRLLACQPDRAAAYNNVIQYALSLVASESVRIYVAINDATLNLVDKVRLGSVIIFSHQHFSQIGIKLALQQFFEMQQHDAVRALEIYKKTGIQSERLSEFYEACRGLDFGRRQNFIKIEQPPASFITTMEEYVREAPRLLMLQWNAVNNDDTEATKTVGAPDSVLSVTPKSKEDVEENLETPIIDLESSASVPSGAPVAPPVIDLLGFDEISQDASELDEKNAHALAIINSDPLNLSNGPAEFMGWELALVTAPSSNATAVAESKLAGGLDKLALDSLYEDAMARRTNQNGTYHTGQVGPNPFETDQYRQDPFSASSNIAPPTNVQMAVMTQQQQAFMTEQQHQKQRPVVSQNPTNPFGDQYDGQDVSTGQSQNIYTGLI